MISLGAYTRVVYTTKTCLHLQVSLPPPPPPLSSPNTHLLADSSSGVSVPHKAEPVQELHPFF